MLACVDSFHGGQDRGSSRIDKNFLSFKENFLFIVRDDLYRIVGYKRCRTVIQRNIGVLLDTLVILVPQE